MGIETHILDFNQDVYEKEVRVVFLKHLRDEIKFENVDALFQQIASDKQAALHYFNC